MLTTEQETGFVKRIIRLPNVGEAMTSKMLRVQAFSFCKIRKIKKTFNGPKNFAGKKWLNLFPKRHLVLVRRKGHKMNSARAQKLSEDIVGNHFSKYKNVLSRLEIEHLKH